MILYVIVKLYKTPEYLQIIVKTKKKKKPLINKYYILIGLTSFKTKMYYIVPIY